MIDGATAAEDTSSSTNTVQNTDNAVQPLDTPIPTAVTEVPVQVQVQAPVPIAQTGSVNLLDWDDAPAPVPVQAQAPAAVPTQQANAPLSFGNAIADMTPPRFQELWGQLNDVRNERVYANNAPCRATTQSIEEILRQNNVSI